jgi:asparagine synthase (glutamine-hydrolysing)
MCGIAGHFGEPRAAGVRARMRAALARRGPDAQHDAAFDARGRRLADDAHADVGLVHTRLSIIDPRPIADQPMATDDGLVWIVYNGEVYGWQADARELEGAGVRFKTWCDTEFILRGYQAWGIERLLPRLRGMFAFAIVDFRTMRVHAVRDRLGLKPLVYAHSAQGLAFGSTVRSVLPWLPPAARAFSADAIDAYLAHRYVPAPRTVFAGIARLPNAHRLEYDMASRSLAVHRYWQPAPVAAQDHRALLDEAIELRLVADRPLGLFLSGGVDSATIACRLAATGHRALRSFSAAFPGSSLDESDDAAATARALGLPNERIVIPTSIRDDFAEIVATLDEPFADPSSFPTWYLARETERHVKVVLGGDGGDELFAGYKRVAKHVRNAWRENFRLPAPTLPDARPKGWRKAWAELAVDWQDAYALRFSGLTPNQRAYLQP